MGWLHEETKRRIITGVPAALKDGTRLFPHETGGLIRCGKCGQRIAACALCREAIWIREFGVKGSCDIRGFQPKPFPMHPLPIEIEIKTKGDSRSDQQIAWAEMCTKMGMFYRLVHVSDESEINDVVKFLTNELREA